MANPALYRGMDADTLEAQYNIRAAVPEHPAYFEGWRRRSATARLMRPGRLGQRFGPEPRQTMDVFVPSRAELRPRPMVVFVHGGYWQAMDKAHFSYIAPPFVDQGVPVAVIGYTLCPDIDMDGMIAQIRAAVAWLAANRGALGTGDGDLVMCGHSAGGHLAAMMALTDWTQWGLAQSPVSAIVAISGVFDLDPIRHTSLNTKLGLTAETARRASPHHLLATVPPPADCPLLAAVGGTESSEFHRQQADFVTAWRQGGGRADTCQLPGCNHFDAVDTLADPHSPLYQAVLDRASP